MKHFTFFCVAVMSLTIIMVVLSGCKEPNNSSTNQTSETTTEDNTNSPSDSNLTKPEETADVQDVKPTDDLTESGLTEDLDITELQAPELPETEPEDAPETPELTPPALPEDESENAPETPELTPPALPETEPEDAPETPELTPPALPETEPEDAPETPELTPPALPETEPEDAPETPELTPPAVPETEPEVAPETPEITPPALPETEPEVAPETPEITPPALTEAESERTPEVPELKTPALPETEPEVAPETPAAPDVLQTEDMDLAELPDSAAETQKAEPQSQPEKTAAAQPDTIGPKPTQVKTAQAEPTPSAPAVPETSEAQAAKPDTTPAADTANAADANTNKEPKWESKNKSKTEPNTLKEDAANLVQSEMQKLDDSLDLNLVEPADTTESRVIPPPPKKNTADATEPGTLPSQTAQASDDPADKPNNPLLEDIPQKESDQSNNAAADSQTDANQPNEIVKPPFDPIKENGPIFVGWGVPRVALVITGQQNGYLEPCGCAGLDRMKGGLSRRYSFIKGLRDNGWPVIALDVGGMCNSFGKQAELKFHTTASALRAMGYNAIALGKAELGFPAADILSEIVNADGTPGMFVSANVSVFERDAGMPPTYKILQANGLKFGITSVLCKSAQNFSQNDEILLSPTKESLNKVVPILKEKSDIRILLSHGTVEEALAIAKDYPDFQVIVTAGGNPEPPSKPVILPSGQYIITVGQKGMCSIVLGFFDKGVLKYQRVPHDSRFEQSDVVRQMMQSYQDQLKELWLDGLGIRPVPQTDQTRGANVGPKKCQTCHEYQYDVWKKSKHAHAFKSLEDAKPARDFDPECVCCHVVGWHRHLYFPYQKGYIKPGEDDHLKNVSCEACHGPGEAHIAAESSSNVENQKAQREKLHIDLKYAKEKMCGDCHDLDNSPNFDPDKYWELIKHPEPDDED
ncbi:MAG: hypothetical protein IKX40_12605 [Thermoguttaceae bacterium]|nr:hypothetical protein [Thermoguttaceae bacterium]